jgi:ABC-type phosphate transport system substrate-binding protein
MTRSKIGILALIVALAIAVVPAAQAAVTVHFIGAGSTAMFQQSGVAVANVLAGAGSHHYSISGNCTSGPCAYFREQRGGGTIPNESGNIWVVWNSAQTEVWAYLAVDSVVGNRAFFATPRPLLQLDPDTNNGTKHGANLLSPVLFTSGDATADASCGGLTTCDATSIPSNIYLALVSHVITAGLTDIRPEDAEFAQSRIANKLTSTLSGLGYGTAKTTLISTPIKSSFSSSSQANPIAFNIKGKDPFTGQKVPTNYTTIPLGASPIVFVVNQTGAGALSDVTNATTAQVQAVFGGDDCSNTALGSSNPAHAITALLREPLSGTYNTAEYTVFRLYTSTKAPKTSQEKNVGQPTPGTPANPLSAAGGILDGGKPCKTVHGVTGARYRGVGTGQIISGASGVGGVKNIPDSIGYTFFSFGNVNALAANSNYKYIQLDGIDPIFDTYCDAGPCGNPGQLTGGKLPLCDVTKNGMSGLGCLPGDVWTGGIGTSYPNVRNGTYRAWSILRMIAPNNDADAANVASALQAQVNTTVTDFVPYNAGGGDPGVQVYRAHFKQAKMATGGPSNSPEIGGDMGGCIFTFPVVNDTAHLNLHQGPGNGVNPPGNGGTCFVHAGLN